VGVQACRNKGIDSWTTLWDRPNRRVLLLAGAKADSHHWGFVKHDETASVPGVYDIWRVESSDDMVVLQLSNADKFVAERLLYVLRLPTRKGCR
jgi:hypothetical protein